MKQVVFNVVSESSGQAYELLAEPTEHGLLFRCSCAAGAMGQFCKHRNLMITGKFTASPGTNEANIAKFNGWLAISRVGAMQTSIAAAEEEVKQAKKRVTMLKHELGRRLEEGTA